MCVCAHSIALTVQHIEGDGGLLQQGPGSQVLGVAHVVVAAVVDHQVGEVKVPVEPDHHPLILTDLVHPYRHTAGNEHRVHQR